MPYRFTAKELDEETGLYYFGARYYDPRTSVWQSVDPILGEYLDGQPSGGVHVPVNLAMYSYVRLSPLSYVDPDGRNWFKIDGAWEWHKGNTHTVKTPTASGVHTETYTSNYTHLVKFVKTSTNKYGAAVGNLTLYEQDKAVASSTVFSGGAGGKPPAANGDYMINLAINNNPVVDSIGDYIDTGGGNYKLGQYYGMQTINSSITWTEKGKTYSLNQPQREWGSMRVRLNEKPGESNSAALGLFLHGKKRLGNYTNGCVAERSEAVLGELLKLKSGNVVHKIPFNVSD